ncbi:MAG: hypothetical protein PHR35_07570 [Kiritimatiellae bacterium]|nr:hypothetical protein [Kiritimatiellia bacterium]
MKRKVGRGFAVLMPALAAGAALAGAWTEPLRVNVQAVKNSGQIAAATRNGKLGIYYHQLSSASTWGRSSYNEFSYVVGADGPLTHVITDEEVFYTYGVAGTQNLGMGFATNGQPVFASLPYADGDAANVRVIRRSAGGTYSYTNVSTTANFGLSGFREAFEVDASNHAHLVWCSEAAGTQQVIYATDSSGSWVTNVLATPAFPHRIKNQGPKPVLALTSNGTVQASLSAGTAALPSRPEFYHVDGTVVRDTGFSAGGSTPGPRHDIEVAPNGDVLIAHVTQLPLYTSGKFTLTSYNGSTYTNNDVCSLVGDVRNYGWYGISPYHDLEIDGEGRPAVLIARSNYTVASVITTNYLEYYVYDDGMWAGGLIRTISSSDGLQGLDLVFDEAGRPFIVFSVKDLDRGDTLANVYLMTTPTPGGTVLVIR